MAGSLFFYSSRTFVAFFNPEILSVNQNKEINWIKQESTNVKTHNTNILNAHEELIKLGGV